ADGMRPHVERIDVPRGGALTGIVVRLEPGAVLEGRVEDVAGEPIPNATVTWRKHETVRNARTDAAGRFHLTGLAPGAIEVDVDAEGYQAREDQPVVAGDRDVVFR